MAQKTLFLVHNGKARKKVRGGHAAELNRSLSPTGKKQVAARSDLLASMGVTFNRALSSDAVSAIQTGAGVSRISSGAMNFHVIQELSIADPALGGDAQILDDLFKKLGYAPPRAWFQHPDGGALERYVQTAAKTIRQVFAESDLDETVGAFSHAVFTQAIAIALIGESMPSANDELLDLVLNEVGVIKIVFRKNVLDQYEVIEYEVFN